MYNAATLKSSLLSLVGWRQNEDPAGEQLTGLTTSDSGLYFNDEHPLLTIDNLLSVAPDFSRITYTAWNGGTAYVTGDIVSQGGVNYIAIAASTNQTPPNATYWEVYSPFTAWLQQKTEAGIIRAIQTWLDRKSKLKTAGNLVERTRLFETANRQADTDTAGTRIVGIEILPARSRGMVVNVEQVGVQFDTNGSVTVYLFHNEDITPEQTQVITYTGNGALQWQTVNWQLEGHGAYYVVYDQAAAPGQSINQIKTYNARDYQYRAVYEIWGRYFEPTPFRAPTGATSAAMWDIDGNEYTIDTNYGINLLMNVQCDYTSFIVAQKDLFKDVISKQVAMDMLRLLAYNAETRVNRHESNVQRNEILYEIDGDTQGRKGGLRYMFDQALDAIQFDTEKIDPVCLTCRKRGVKYRAV